MIVTGAFGSVTSSVARLTVFSRVIADVFDPGADGYVASVAEQVDGRLIVGGGFNQISGLRRPFLARLQVDGTPDPAFSPGVNDAVLTMVIQPDGKIVVGGMFTRIGGQPQAYLARLNPDGTLDPAFHPQVDWLVLTMAPLPDGKLLIGGAFTAVDQVRHNHLARLNPDGTADAAFTTEADDFVHVLAMQEDGKVLVGGSFKTLGDSVMGCLGRLAPSGIVDSGFRHDTMVGAIYALVARPDGTILAGGNFSVGGWWGARQFLLPITQDGTLGSGLPLNGTVDALALQTDGKVVVGGEFDVFHGQVREGLVRINPDGTLDTTFNAVTRGEVFTLAIQSDGKVLAGGDFIQLGGRSRSNFGRLGNTEPVVQRLTHDASGITWLRTGTGPEVSRAAFELSSDGVTWSQAGFGTRTPSGWQLSGVSLPSGTSIRARGYAASGSTWIVQSQSLIPGASPPPRFVVPGTVMLPGDRFLLGVNSAPGAVLELQACESFHSAWQPVLLLANHTGQAWISDPTPSQPRRLYRVREVK